ncbi:ZPR1 zinc finger domain-containing protein [Candidatus Woesearchaeota archaeon]|nr:ZPR1 zinc finger domain-containing protein [Candidatus Woesearchaeota archaeon]
MAEIKNQPCPICGKKGLTLKEEEVEIPYFGKVFVFSMNCVECHYNKSDLEPIEKKEPCKFTLEIDSEDDLNVKIVKSGEATIKIPHVITIESGPTSNGYITNVEGLLERVKRIIEGAVDAEDDKARKKAKNLIKKINKVIFGKEKLKIIVEDPSGNSAIISDKATKGKL